MRFFWQMIACLHCKKLCLTTFSLNEYDDDDDDVTLSYNKG